ncbi:MAG: nickel-binding protein [Planctomycetota bacterium]
MRKFIVRRDIRGIGAVSRREWAERADRTNELIARELSPELVWVESQVGADRAYCTYYAKSEEVVRRHSELAGLPVHSIDEIATVVVPSDGADALGGDKARIRATYDAAADHFDAPPLGFWARAGRRTVDLLDPQPGARVLDVGCGSGASALPAAVRVGADGYVLGVDLSQELLGLAREKARDLSLGNTEFRVSDMTALGLPDGHFDAVVSVFSLFFVEDMPALLGDLWRLVRPGGRLAVGTWGARVFEPANSVWWRTVLEECPDLRLPFRPWERIQEPASLAGLFEGAGIPAPTVQAVEDRQPLDAADDWWTIVLGSGMRRTVEQIGPAAADRVRRRTLEHLTAGGVRQVECNTLHAVATKARPG